MTPKHLTSLSVRTAEEAKEQVALKVALPKEKLLTLYEEMVLIRRFEERASQLYGQGKIGGFCHLYIGQEAVAVGAYAAKQEQDTFVTAYRDHGHMLVCGMDPGRVMAELLGRVDGTSRGKGGSMHMFDLDKKFLGGHGIVGAQVPLGTGVAFAHKYKEDDGVCLTFMGDGAANQGQVYESFNMAALWQLPAVFVIENNGYAMGTSVERACAKSDQMFRRGEPWGIEGEQVDGMDVEAVYSATERACAHARAGKGPVLLEMTTYRYRGHSMSDPAQYRDRKEVDAVRSNKDPLMLCQEVLKERYGVSEDALKSTEKAVKDKIKQAVQFAESSDTPGEALLWEDVLADVETAASTCRDDG